MEKCVGIVDNRASEHINITDREKLLNIIPFCNNSAIILIDKVFNLC